MEAAKPKKEKPKEGRKKKKSKKLKIKRKEDDPQVTMAKQQAEVLKESAARLSQPPELAVNGGVNNPRALRLRLDLNLDAEIQLKAKIKGYVKLTLL